jgi:hypothetical protein
MLLDKNLNKGLFFAPKTGSVSLFNMFKDIPNLNESEHNHKNYNILNKKDKIENIDDYKFLCFYRDPIDKFISSINYLKRDPANASRILHFFYGVTATRILSTMSYTYNELTDENKVRVDNIKPIEFLECASKLDIVVFRYQTYWIDAPNTTLLNYADFNNSVEKVAEFFQIPVPSNILKENVSAPLHSVSELTNSEKDQIKLYFKADYDFLASKGISF